MNKKDDDDDDEDDDDTTKFQQLKKKLKTSWDRFLFKPKDSFKIKWDIFVIVLSIWNAI